MLIRKQRHSGLSFLTTITMNTSTTSVLFLLLSLLTLATVKTGQQFECYECDPSSEKCLSPHANNITPVSCDSGVELLINATEKSEYECYSLYFIAWTKDSESGVYRGCVEKGAMAFLVDAFKTTWKIGNITNWVTCAESRCNVHDLRSKA